MALSAAQKTKILRLLCYPYGAIDPTSIDYNRGVERRLSDVAGDVQVEVEILLSRVETTDAQLVKAIERGNVKSIDDIEFFEGKDSTLRSEKNRLVKDLAHWIGVPSMCAGGAMGNICI